jgi:uncharacterized membrane protein YgcG
MKSVALSGFIGSLLFLAVSYITVAQSLPDYLGVVSDQANAIEANEEAILGLKLLDNETLTGHKFLFHTTSDLGGRSIEEYGANLLGHWHLNSATTPPATLLILAPNAGLVRWQLNEAAQKEFPLASQNRVLNEIMLPFFKKADFFSGVSRGFDAAVDQISIANKRREAKNNVSLAYAKPDQSEASGSGILATLIGPQSLALKLLAILAFGLLLAMTGLLIASLSGRFKRRSISQDRTELKPIGFGGQLTAVSW